MRSVMASMSQMCQKTDQNFFNITIPANAEHSLTTKIKMPLISHTSTTPQQNIHEKQISKDSTITQQQPLNKQDVECKLYTLHGRLRQEADKIRQWKLLTETELKQKEKKIFESTQTIDNLRKSIFELQIQNENLSLKMQDELVNREEVLKKIEFTRKMCNIVKEHSQTLENKMIQCEVESNELKYQEREHFEKFEEISVKFKDLNISAKKDQNKLINEINNVVLDKEKLRKSLEKKLDDMQKVMEELQNEIEYRDSKIEQLNCKLENVEDSKNKLKVEYDKSKKSLLELELKYTASKSESTEKNNEISSKVVLLESCQEETNQAYEALKKEQKELSIKYTTANKIIEDLKSDKDMLILEKAELNKSLKEQLDCKNQLQMQLDVKIVKIENLNQSIFGLNDELDSTKMINTDALNMQERTKEQLSNLEENYKIFKKEAEVLHKEFQRKNNQLEDTLKHCEERGKHEAVNFNKELSESKRKNKLLAEEISNLNKKMETGRNEYKTSITKLEMSVDENLVSSKNYQRELDEKHSQLREYKDKLQKMQDVIDDYKKEKTILVKYKQDLQEMTQMKKEAVKEKFKAIEVCECQRQEMMNTLEKYKQENQKIIDMKEKEIESLHSQNENYCKELKNKFENDLKEKRSEWENEISKSKNEISELKQTIEIKSKENSQLQSKLNIMLKNKETLNKQISSTPKKHSVFPTRNTSQVAVMVTPQTTVRMNPQTAIKMTPTIFQVKSMKSNLSRKRKVVFNSDEATFVSDTDSSLSEYQQQKGAFLRSLPAPQKYKPNISSSEKINIPKSFLKDPVIPEESILDGKRKSKTRKKIIKEEIPKKQKSDKNKPKMTNLKNTSGQPKGKFFSSPLKSRKKNKPEDNNMSWFDVDTIFGFGPDD